MPLASSGSTIGLVREATPPACQIQLTMTTPFSAGCGQFLADLGVLPAVALLVGGHQAGHQADVHFRDFAAGIRQRHQRHVQRALAQRRELGVGLHQRGAG
jgi:hypothetical protein